MAVAALILAVFGVGLELASGPGSRLGLWDFRAGMSLIRWGFWLALGGLAVCQVLLLNAWRGGRRLPRLALAGWLLALPAVLVPLGWQRARLTVPMHNDYTTDPQDPPAFTVTPKNGPSSGAPGLEPKILEATEEQAFERALQTAQLSGWEIVRAEDGVIEAVATTFWFGFKDDVVIRVRPANGMSRVDVRSASRVGKSDLGANARRIKAYLRKLGR